MTRGSGKDVLGKVLGQHLRDPSGVLLDVRVMLGGLYSTHGGILSEDSSITYETDKHVT